MIRGAGLFASLVAALADVGRYRARVDVDRRTGSHSVRFSPYAPRMSQQKRRRLERGRHR